MSKIMQRIKLSMQRNNVYKNAKLHKHDAINKTASCIYALLNTKI